MEAHVLKFWEAVQHTVIVTRQHDAFHIVSGLVVQDALDPQLVLVRDIRLPLVHRALARIIRPQRERVIIPIELEQLIEQHHPHTDILLEVAEFEVRLLHILLQPLRGIRHHLRVPDRAYP